MPPSAPTPPNDKQIAFAKSIAKKRGEQLPESVTSDVNACRAYLDAYAPNKSKENPTKNNITQAKPSGVQESASDSQTSYAKQIQKKLSDSIDEKELALALLSKRNCSKFIEKNEGNYKTKIELEKKLREKKSLDKLRQEINSLELITPDLRNQVSTAETTEQKCEVVRSFKKEGKGGFSRIDASKLNSIQEKLLGYWLEGLQSTAFDSLANLDNLIGESKSSFQFDEIEALLSNQKCPDINFDQPQMPIRHLVLKLEKEKSAEKKPIVISVLPLVAKPDPNDPKGYRWHPAVERVPLFNRNLVGESTKFPGLMLSNEDQFDIWATKLEDKSASSEDADESNSGELSDALAIWNEAFDVLSDPGYEGIIGWIGRFNDTKTEFWQVKKHNAVFTLVDGSAADGPSRQVCNVYRQLLVEPETLKHQSLKLFRRIADVFPVSHKPYIVNEQAEDLTHITRYLGHMDSFKDGKREAFPLDPAQRDALIALAMTDDGNLLAVNGPPGTGKTSLLRGVIASAWVTPLCSKVKDPTCPVILACAATNQAVTNIISSFDETPGEVMFDEMSDFLFKSELGVDSRWLPRLTSYGWYVSDVIDAKRKGYGKYQIIDRKGSHKPWQFDGATHGFGDLTTAQIEDAYLKCAERFFGVQIDLPTILTRLRNKVISDTANIGQLQQNIRNWFKVLIALVNSEPWTANHENQRHQLIEKSEQLSGKSGKRKQLEVNITAIETRIDSLAKHNDFNAILPIYTSLLASLPSTDPSRSETDYASIKQQYEDLGTLASKLEESRHQTFMQRVKKAFAAAFNRDEVELRWTVLRETMHSFNLHVDEGQPDIDKWLSLIGNKRTELRDRLELAAAEGVRLHLSKHGIKLTSTLNFRSEWTREIDEQRENLRAERSKLVLEVSVIDEQLAALKKALYFLDKIRQAFLAAKEEVSTAQNTLISTMTSLDGDTSEEVAILKSMKNGFQEALSFTLNQEGLIQLLHDINKHAQDWLDTRVRTRIFHFAARYWEGRYIASRKKSAVRAQQDETFVMRSDEQLRELAMLAPVFVVTAFSAPKLMRRNLKNLEENAPPYLFGEADLLIVDEAGQGTAEIGANVFLFAKKAIVVGDIAQLEPVWNMGEAADKGLAQRFGITQLPLIDGKTPYEILKPSGILIAKGSVMRMAQRATLWSNPDFPDTPGLTLTNHYRCLSPIIEICNRMVYRGALRVATRQPKKLWRPELQRLGFLVTDEVSNTKNPGGSRRNQSEAECIAQWVYENEASIVKHFSSKDIAKIENLLAIVTPFSGQKLALKKAMQKQYGLKWDEQDKTLIYNKITIDTVHTLQGAERQIVIFAMVETNDPTSPQFYDKGANLINVAISRAKEMFIVAMTQKAVNYARNLTDSPLSKPSDYLWQAIVTTGSRLNSRRLILVESPNKCAIVKEALGSSIELEVIATEGHIAELEKPENWDSLNAVKPVWSSLSDAGEKAFRRIEVLWPDISACYLATDPDPEGEAIAWHILRIMKDRKSSGDISSVSGSMPTVKRMRFYNLSQEDIFSAYQNASDGLDAGLVKSAITRTLLDHLIATEYPKRLGLSNETKFVRGIGRVQLGALDLINQSIQAPKKYAVRVTIPLKDGPCVSTYAINPSKSDSTSVDRIWTTTEIVKAEKAVKRIQESLQREEIETSVKWYGYPLVQCQTYPSLNTARLLALAWRSKRLAPDETMTALQNLYEGVTTTQQRRNISNKANNQDAVPQFEELT